MPGWTLIGSAHATQNTAGALAQIASTPAVPKGALVVVIAVNVTAAQTTDAITDARGNTYTRKVSGALALYESYNLATALQSGDSITYTPAAANKDASILAFYRTDAITDSDPFDASATGTSTSTSPSSGATGASAQPNEAALSWIWALPSSQTTFTAGSGWTALTGLSWNDTANSFWMELFAEYQEPVSAAVTGNGTLSGSSFWVAESATFKLAPAPHITTALGALPSALLRPDMRAQRFIGPFPLADAITILPPGPPLVLAIVSANPLGRLPQTHKVRKTPWVQTFPLAPLNPVFTPPPPPPPTPADRILTRLGALPDALRPRFRFLRPAALPDASVLLAVAAQPRIPEALLAAQRAATAQPVITAILRAKRGSAYRLDTNIFYTAALTEVAEAVAAPDNANIVRARLSGGNVQVQSLAASTGSAWTSWTTLAAALAPPAGLGVALTTEGNSVVIAYVKSGANTTVQVQASFDYGATWGAAVSVANTGVITDLAIAYNPNGDLVLVTADNGGTIRAFRSANFGATWGAAVSLVPPGSTFISSIALAYSGNDWYALFGWQTGDLALIGSAIFGNGGQQGANTWSAVTDVLGVDPGSGNTPNVTGFAWGGDGGHAILVETWAVLGGYNATNAYAMECSSTVAFLGGYWTEPAPFPYTSADSTTIFGPDLAYTQAVPGRYVAAAENLVAVLAPPADIDVSVRVIAVESLSEYHAGHTLLILDNSDGAYTTLATNRGTLGLRLDLALGYQTIDGPMTLPQPARWVVKAESSWVTGRHLVTLTCHDGWQLLHQLTTRRQAQFGTTLGLPTLSVDQLLHWLCAKAGIDYIAAAATTLNARTPNWTAYPGRTLGTLVLEFLDTIEGFLLMTDIGATVIQLSSTADPVVYTYGGAGEHIAMQVFHTVELQAANLITIYNGPQGQAIAAQAFDPTDAHRLGNLAHEHSDTQLGTGSDSAVAPLTLAANTAAAILRKAQVSAPLHSLICPPQVGQLLGDVVTLVDPLTGTQYFGRVQSIALHYDRDKGLWQHTIGLSGT